MAKSSNSKGPGKFKSAETGKYIKKTEADKKPNESYKEGTKKKKPK